MDGSFASYVDEAPWLFLCLNCHIDLKLEPERAINDLQPPQIPTNRTTPHPKKQTPSAFSAKALLRPPASQTWQMSWQIFGCDKAMNTLQTTNTLKK